MAEPKVSVIIPVYNVEKYIKTCIESLVAQTLSDIELIFVNDASPDNSIEIVKEYRDKYPEIIRIINSKKNRRQGGARNIGIKYARGKYVGFVDSDDFVSNTMFEDMYDRAVANDADVVFVQYSSVDSDAEEIPDDPVKPLVMWDKQLLECSNRLLNDNERELLIALPFGGVYCGLWRRNIIIENDLFFPEKVRYEDNYWGSLMRAYVNKVSFIEKVEYFYRQAPESTVHKRNPDYHRDRMYVEKKLLHEVKKRQLFDKYFRAWEYTFIYRFCINSYISYVSLFDKVEYNKLKYIVKSLNSEFPDWYKNKYYCSETSFKRRILMRLINTAPGITGVILNRIYKFK